MENVLLTWSSATTSVLLAWLGLKAMALAWLEVALAFRNPRPGQSHCSGLGPAWATAFLSKMSDCKYY